MIAGRIFKDSIILTFAFQHAMMRDDLDFFARVGDVLRKRQENVESVVSEIIGPKLQKFLLNHWAKEIEGIPVLCRLSRVQLAKTCRKYLKIENLTDDAIEKTKQRLGLKSLRRRSRP
ncbi:MAG: hypothetical protein EPO07_11625 [Verrucomicrobia bacterium]|nr:MAG: hypothetical protein EPO07_11625 [Verrucomicrobiota bacterium]